MDSYNGRLERLEKRKGNDSGKSSSRLQVRYVKPGCERLKARGNCDKCGRVEKCEYITPGEVFNLGAVR